MQLDVLGQGRAVDRIKHGEFHGARCEDFRWRLKSQALTTRERQIAKLAAASVSSKEIADQLYLSARTVDNHLLRVYAKLGITGRADLAAALRAVPGEDGT